ncbi:glycosyltransferase [Enterococcus faecium]|uniref:glycosyltransferase n=1 Tax=Enterococcus faecium TaxID=1352 RepID=UPI002543BA91|nr:glycosyltransferase [Enterococcus faecium]MDK4441006.1 glycosyltransferase [Enterococcus faecium]
MNVLFLATYGDFLATFEYSNILIWQELGATVHCASNFSNLEYNLKKDRLDKINVIKHEINFSRSPLNSGNIKAYISLVRLIKKNNIDVIDCHNAVVGTLARLAAKQCNIKKVIYTPHSFFFYKGCPLKNKLIYRNVERFMARSTDLLISINQEDYLASLDMPVRGKQLYVPGVGIDIEEIRQIKKERNKYCTELNIPVNSVIFISVGELIDRKNHLCAIEAFAKADLKDAYYIICGIGELEKELRDRIRELGIEDKIKLLGYRLDVKQIMKSADIFIFPSIQEGLPVALMEAMACGLPCLTSRIRGNVDLIVESKGGYFFYPNDSNQLSVLIKNVYSNLAKIRLMGDYNQARIQEFDIKNIRSIMQKEYKKLMLK